MAFAESPSVTTTIAHDKRDTPVVRLALVLRSQRKPTRVHGKVVVFRIVACCEADMVFDTTIRSLSIGLRAPLGAIRGLFLDIVSVCYNTLV